MLLHPVMGVLSPNLDKVIQVLEKAPAFQSLFGHRRREGRSHGLRGPVGGREEGRGKQDRTSSGDDRRDDESRVCQGRAATSGSDDQGRGGSRAVYAWEGGARREKGEREDEDEDGGAMHLGGWLMQVDGVVGLDWFWWGTDL